MKLLPLATCKVVFKSIFVFIKLSNVKFVCLKARVFLVTIMKWRISGQDTNRIPRAGENISPTISLFFRKMTV